MLQLPDPLPWYLGRTAMLTWATLLVAPALCELGFGQGSSARWAKAIAVQ